MPRCLEVMHQYGQVPAVTDIRHMTPPDTLVDMCPGDFLGSDSATGVLKAALIQTDQAWDTNLATTQTTMRKFKGYKVLVPSYSMILYFSPWPAAFSSALISFFNSIIRSSRSTVRALNRSSSCIFCFSARSAFLRTEISVSAPR